MCLFLVSKMNQYINIVKGVPCLLHRDNDFILTFLFNKQDARVQSLFIPEQPETYENYNILPKILETYKIDSSPVFNI